MTEKINPYIAGAPVVEARMFFGREDTFSWMTRSLAGKYVDHILVIHGQRRVGKTSVLKHLSTHLPEQYIPIFIDLQGRVSTTLDRFLWWLAREIVRALTEEGIELPRPEREAFTQDPEYFETHFLPVLEEKLDDKRLLLTFDEFDTLSSTAAQEGLALPFLAILKRMMEHEKLNFIFSIGSSGRKLENMQATYTAFFKQALYKKISFLDWEDARDLIVKPVEGVLSYDEEAIQYIYDLTSGHPYFIQLVCHELFSTCQKTEDWKVTRETVEAVLDSVIERGTVNLKFVWDEASNLEKWVLASLALFEGGTDLPNLEEHLRSERVRFTRQDLEAALVNLREKDVITGENRFVIHLMRRWLRQNRSMEQVRDELEEVDPIVSRFLEIGQEYHDSGEHEQAIGAFERALEAAPQNLEARQGLGTALLALGDYGEAANEFEAALEISPDDVVAQAGYCDAYMALGDLEVSFNRLEQGEYAYRKVLQINPQHADGLKRMAGIHHRRAVKAIIGGEEVALMELERAKRLVPEESLFDELIEDLIALSEGKLDLPDLLRSWGERIFVKGLWDEAVELFGAYQRISGDQEAVAERLNEVKEKVREDRLSIYGTQAERMTRLRRYGEAIEAWEAILAMNPPNPEEVRESIAALKAEREALQASTAEAPARPLWRNVWAWAGLVVVALLAIWLASPGSPLRAASPEPTELSAISGTYTFTATATTVEPTPTRTPRPTRTPTPVPTVIPLEWGRVSSAQFLSRDYVTSILVDPSDPDVMYAGMARSGVFKTIDGGISWFPIHNGLNRGWIHNMVINPENPDEIYAGALFSGLYKTENGGDSWVYLDTGVKDFWQSTSDVAINHADPDHIAYTGGNNISTSRDGGSTWKNYDSNEWSFIAEGDFEFNGTLSSLAINPSTGDLLVAGDDFSNRYIFLSGDGGNTLELVHTIQGSASGATIFVNPQKVEFYFSGDGKATYRAGEDGRNWELWTSQPVVPMDVSSEGIFYAAFSNQIRYSFDSGASWIFSSPSNDEIRSLSSSRSDPDTVAAGGESVYVSKDGGLSWEERGNGLGATRTEIGFGETSGVIFLREDRCTSACVPGDGTFYTYNLSSGETQLVTSQSCGSNPGSEWEKTLCLGELDSHPLFPGVVFGYFPSPSDPEIGYFNLGPVLQRTNDGGTTWESCDNWNFSWVSEMNSAVAIHPDNPGDIYVATADGLGITRNGCSSWVDPKGLDARHINSVALNPEVPEIVYAGTDAGVYISYDAGDNWGVVNDGLLGALMIYSVAVDPANPDNVYVSTPYGIFKLESK